MKWFSEAMCSFKACRTLRDTVCNEIVEFLVAKPWQSNFCIDPNKHSNNARPGKMEFTNETTGLLRFFSIPEGSSLAMVPSVVQMRH